MSEAVYCTTIQTTTSILCCAVHKCKAHSLLNFGNVLRRDESNYNFRHLEFNRSQTVELSLSAMSTQ